MDKRFIFQGGKTPRCHSQSHGLPLKLRRLPVRHVARQRIVVPFGPQSGKYLLQDRLSLLWRSASRVTCLCSLYMWYLDDVLLCCIILPHIRGGISDTHSCGVC